MGNHTDELPHVQKSTVERITDLKRIYRNRVALSTEVGDDGFFVLQKCGAKELFLDETLMTNNGVCAIPLHQQYERLSLAKTIVDDNSAFHLSKISRVEHLDLSHTQITERGMMSLLLEQKALVSLRIVGCAISSEAIIKARQLHPGVRIVSEDNGEAAAGQ